MRSESRLPTSVSLLFSCAQAPARIQNKRRGSRDNLHGRGSRRGTGRAQAGQTKREFSRLFRSDNLRRGTVHPRPNSVSLRLVYTLQATALVDGAYVRIVDGNRDQAIAKHPFDPGAFRQIPESGHRITACFRLTSIGSAEAKAKPGVSGIRICSGCQNDLRLDLSQGGSRRDPEVGRRVSGNPRTAVHASVPWLPRQS